MFIWLPACVSSHRCAPSQHFQNRPARNHPQPMSPHFRRPSPSANQYLLPQPKIEERPSRMSESMSIDTNQNMPPPPLRHPSAQGKLSLNSRGSSVHSASQQQMSFQSTVGTSRKVEYHQHPSASSGNKSQAKTQRGGSC